jgi:hypothetical protein
MATISWHEGGGGGGRGGGGERGGVEELLMPSHSEMASAVRSRLAERFKREDSALKIKLGIFNTPHDSLKEISEGDMKTSGEGDVDGGASANQGVFGRGAAGIGSMAQRGDPFSSLLQVQASAGGITAADDMSEAGLTTNVGFRTPRRPLLPPLLSSPLLSFQPFDHATSHHITSHHTVITRRPCNHATTPCDNSTIHTS